VLNPKYENSSKRRTASKNEIVFLIKGDESGRPAWAYVKIEKAKLPLFQHDVKTNFLDISKYGKKIYSGWGKEPPKDIVLKVKQTFG